MQAIIFAREEKGNKERVQLRKKEMVGADGSNGKDGTFCGKEKMQMSVYYSIGSILLGLAAWWIPYAARGKVRNFGGLSKYVFLSFCCCVAALFLQFLEIRYRVQIRDFAGLMDTIGAIVVAAVVLIMGTFGMNGVVYLYVREKFEAVR